MLLWLYFIYYNCFIVYIISIIYFGILYINQKYEIADAMSTLRCGNTF